MDLQVGLTVIMEGYIKDIKINMQKHRSQCKQKNYVTFVTIAKTTSWINGS